MNILYQSQRRCSPIIKRVVTMSTTTTPYTFYAVADTGTRTPQLQDVAQAMHSYASKGSVEEAPVMVLGLGDNFYPSGVQSVDDELFRKTWAEVFLVHKSLRVPWFMVLGNHDYMGNPRAQIEYTHHKNNPFNLWKMPDTHYKVALYKDQLAEYFFLDTNGCQHHVTKKHPDAVKELKSQMSWLDIGLKESTSTWKFVLGHHPMYNKGKGHAAVANCLREEQYTYSHHDDSNESSSGEEVKANGFGLENIVSKYERVIYLSGHEHVFQHHKANGVQHVICGNSGANVGEGGGFYDGTNDNVDIDWYDKDNVHGFVAVTVAHNCVTLDFVNTRGESFEQVKVLNADE